MDRTQKLSRIIYAIFDSGVFAPKARADLLNVLANGLHEVIKLSATVSLDPQKLNPILDKVRAGDSKALEDLFVNIKEDLDSERANLIQQMYYVNFIKAVVESVEDANRVKLAELLSSLNFTPDLVDEITLAYKQELEAAKNKKYNIF